MEARITVNPESIVVIPGKVYNMADIARLAGTTYSTTRTALVSDSPKVGSATRSKIREIAKRVGYVPKQLRKYGYYDGNFGSREAEKQKMLELRRRGYTNPEIAHMIGRHYVTVLHAIGPQPDELTEMSRALAAEGLVRRNQARKKYVLSQKIAQFETFRKEAEAIDAKAKELELQAQRIADEAKAVREQYSAKVVELDAYRKEAEEAAAKLGRTLA